MNILIINGSAKADKGTTQLIINHIENNLKDDTVNIFYPAQNIINECIDCKKCFTNIGNCIFEDDMEQYLKEWDKSDLIILASPIYSYSMSSHLKKVLDRIRPLQTGKYKMNANGEFSPITRNKKKFSFLLISTCGFPEINNFKVIETWFDSFIDQYENYYSAGKIFLPASQIIFSSSFIEKFKKQIEKNMANIKTLNYFEIKKEWIDKNEFSKILTKYNAFVE